MGKKDKKKGKGAEKTLMKTEKKQNAKQRKALALLGEEDIAVMVNKLEAAEKTRKTEVIAATPTRRANFTFVPHPTKDELILFGGEFFNGQTTQVYNDLFVYNLAKNEWHQIKSTGAPPPRCGHQMITTPLDNGQLWLFGGEFTSQSESQFHHYKDLWLFHLSTKKWEKVERAGGPSARSGHRMVYVKKQIFVFGGYHDLARDYHYYNDVHVFNLDTYTWKRIETAGVAPAPRSGCCMAVNGDGKILVWGGYCKTRVKKDVDRGCIFTDMYALAVDKHDPTKYKWHSTKASGPKPSPRCSAPATYANNKAFTFGGVFDDEQDEDVSGVFYNDMHGLDLDKMTWFTIDANAGKRTEVVQNGMDVDQTEQTVVDDGVFTVKIGPAPSSSHGKCERGVATGPSPRMNAGMAVKNNTLYIYGGLFEASDKTYTLNDLHAIDLKRTDEWKVVIKDDFANHEWFESDDSDSDESDSSDSDESSSDDASGMDTD